MVQRGEVGKMEQNSVGQHCVDLIDWQRILLKGMVAQTGAKVELHKHF